MQFITNFFSLLWTFITKPFFEIGGNHLSIGTLIITGLIIYLFIKFSKFVEKYTSDILKDKKWIDDGLKGTIESSVKYLVLSMGGFVALDTMGISLSSLAALGAVFMVGIGFGLQNITHNFISGLIVLFERPIKRGDIIKIGDIEGKILNINARSTLILTRDEIAILIPNSQFISEQVINNSHTSNRMRIRIAVGVAYHHNAELIEKTLIEVALRNSDILHDPAPEVFLKNFGDSSIDFELLVWIDNIWKSEIISSKLRFEIKKEFDLKKITIPFPQQDIYIKELPSNRQEVRL